MHGIDGTIHVPGIMTYSETNLKVMIKVLCLHIGLGMSVAFPSYSV
jgi:hypothetical protein